MRIMCYMNKMKDGGAERVMSVLTNGLCRLGHTVILVTDYRCMNEYPINNYVIRFTLDGEFKGTTTKGRIQRNLRRIIALRRLCRKEKPDIVISFMSEANFRAILATRFLKTKNLISVRVDPKIGYKNKLIALTAKLLYPMAEGCVFQTKEAKEWFPGIIQNKSRIILNPVSDSFHNTQGKPLQDKRIVSCGRLNHQKRFDLLIDAFSAICDNFPEYTLEIYGTGDLKEKIEMQIRQLGRQTRIFLKGRCEDIPNAIKDASLFVLSSDFEGLPNALMEAMALGLPVISTDCSGGGARAVIDDGVDGKIVPCGDQDALANAMQASLADQDALEMLGRRAKEKGQTFSAEKIVAIWENYIQEICSVK